MSHKVKLTLTFLLNEDTTPDFFAARVVENCGAPRVGEGVELPSDPSKVLLRSASKSVTPEFLRPPPETHVDRAGKAHTKAVVDYQQALQTYWARRRNLAGGRIEGSATGHKHTLLYKELVRPYEHAMNYAYNALLEACR